MSRRNLQNFLVFGAWVITAWVLISLIVLFVKSYFN